MSKGYVAPRTPGANLVAACQNKTFKGCYIYVEGNSDVSFWKNFLNKSETKIVACNGWPAVVDSVSRAKAEGTLCIGIVDRDFYDYIHEPKKDEDQVFMTDDHDIEMMIYQSGDYEKVINNYDTSDKVEAYENQIQQSLLDEIKAIVDRIAHFRIAVKRNHLNLKFRHQNRKQEIVYPDYENILDRHFEYKTDEDLIKYIINWSQGKVEGVPSDFQTTKQFLEVEDLNQFEESTFLNGHDMTLLMHLFLKKKVKIDIKQTLTPEDFEHQLYIAYEQKSLVATDLYTSIKQYADDNGINIFKF